MVFMFLEMFGCSFFRSVEVSSQQHNRAAGRHVTFISVLGKREHLLVMVVPVFRLG